MVLREKKLPNKQGFTLVELLIAMGISSMVIMGGFQVYNMQVHYAIRARVQMEINDDLFLLEDLIQHDFSAADQVQIVSTNAFKLISHHADGYELQTVMYEATDKGIKRLRSPGSVEKIWCNNCQTTLKLEPRKNPPDNYAPMGYELTLMVSRNMRSTTSKVTGTLKTSAQFVFYNEAPLLLANN